MAAFEILRPDRIVVEVKPELYESQLDDKASWLRELFAPFDMPELEVFASPPSHYRMRGEFRIWHQGRTAQYAMFDTQTREPVFVREYPVMSKAICDLMGPLLDAIVEQDVLRDKLFEVHFLSTLSGDMLVTLIYHRPLSEHWKQAASELAQQFAIKLIGRSRKQLEVFSDHHVLEMLPVDGRTLVYQQVENSFTQPNAAVACHMLEWAIDSVKGHGGDLVELYCGNGNFTIALAPYFDKVLATEISKPSVHSAQFNLQANHIDNARIVRMSAEEFSQALTGVRNFNRLQEVNLDDYSFSTVLVDPPRAGLDADSLELVSRFERIVYISCNPQTLRDNLEVLCQTHEVERFALFDQFPYTHHAECGVYLRRKNAN